MFRVYRILGTSLGFIRFFAALGLISGFRVWSVRGGSGVSMGPILRFRLCDSGPGYPKP